MPNITTNHAITYTNIIIIITRKQSILSKKIPSGHVPTLRLFKGVVPLIDSQSKVAPIITRN